MADGLMDEAAVRALDAEVTAEIADAYRYADEAADPEAGALYADVYAPEKG
jgi:TPP-dependent pyruvate/acetoin dehydrogenase alpha subunit